MILADTSVWIDHLSKPNEVVSRLLRDKKIVLHPFVIGEIALGNLRNRQAILSNLLELRTLRVSAEQDVLSVIEINSLYGMGIGYVDCHLLAAADLARARLWTTDKRLAAAAQKMGLSI